MSVLNLSGDEAPECPLCMELLELDDISFYPCICGYQVSPTFRPYHTGTVPVPTRYLNIKVCMLSFYLGR